jgi:hypothetical protein
MHLFKKWSKYAYASMQINNYPKQSYNEFTFITNKILPNFYCLNFHGYSESRL